MTLAQFRQQLQHQHQPLHQNLQHSQLHQQLKQQQLQQQQLQQQQHHAPPMSQSLQSTARLRAASAQNHAIVTNTQAVHSPPRQHQLLPSSTVKSTQNSKHNIYDFERIEEKAQEKLGRCTKPPSCVTYRAFYGFALDEYSMIDTNKKVLMEFSPKADCTAAVVAYLEASGYEQNIDYFGWPHVFRDSYYNRHCGYATHCLYYDSTWFRFKVVRNPFDRAVSSYLFVMKTWFLIDFLPKQIKKTSFEGFINYLLTLSPDVFQYFCTRHAGPQSQYYERFVYTENQKKILDGNDTSTRDSKNLYPPVFHEIVKVEDSQSAFDRIHQQTGVRYQLKYSSKTHFQSRNSNIHSFVGNLTWDELNQNHSIPQNYGYFYNEDLKGKVEKLYYWDLLLYNYTYPFDHIKEYE